MNNSNNNAGRRVKNSPNQNNKKNRKRNKGPRPQGAARTVPQSILRPCTRHYLGVLSDPFGYFNNGSEVCVPNTTSLPSLKVQTLMRGVVHTGTNKFGFLALNSRAVFNDVHLAVGSNITYTGTTVSNSTVTSNTFTVNDTSAPFAHTAARAYKRVGLGMQVRYIGTMLNRGGLYASIMQTGYLPNLHNMSFAAVASMPEASVTGIGQGWKTLAFKPGNGYNLDWATHDFSYDDGPDMAILMESAEKEQPFEFRIVSFVEYVSHEANRVPSTTLSHSDSLGFSGVREFITSVWNSDASTALYQKGVNYLYKYLAQSIGATGGPLLIGL